MTDFHPSTPITGALETALPVLVIEDEKFLLSYFQAALMRIGVKSAGATSGGEALLPGGIDGAEIFDWVRRNRPPLAQRFMFITGDLQSPYAAEVRERTGATFLEKPFRVAQLLEILGKIMSRGETVHV